MVPKGLLFGKKVCIKFYSKGPLKRFFGKIIYDKMIKIFKRYRKQRYSSCRSRLQNLMQTFSPKSRPFGTISTNALWSSNWLFLSIVLSRTNFQKAKQKMYFIKDFQLCQSSSSYSAEFVPRCRAQLVGQPSPGQARCYESEQSGAAWKRHQHGHDEVCN